MAYVQSDALREFSGATTTALAFTSNVTSGALLAVAIGWSDTTATLDSVTDSLNGAHTIVHNPTSDGSIGRGAMSYFENSAGGACTVTATFSTSDGLRVLYICEFSGRATSSALDKSAMQTQTTGSGTDSTTSGSVTTTTDGQDLFGAALNLNGNSTFTAGTGWTSREAGASNSGGIESLAQTLAGAVEALVTTSAFDVWSAVGIMTFKAAGGGGGGGSVRPPRLSLMGVQ